MAARGGHAGALRLGRRQLLARIAVLLGARVFARVVPAARAGGRDGADAGLREPERRLAALGGVLAAEAPALAAALAGTVATELAALGGGTNAAHAVRRLLLRPARVRDDFTRGDVIRVDGWILARSEAAACAYLHALDVRAQGAG